jgi:type IV pilus assembly protein PilA
MKSSLKAKLIQHLISKKEDGGFTLIELLVVIIIIGILAAIALPSFLNQANKARQSEAKTYVGSFNKGQQAWYTENTAFNAVLPELGVGVRPVTEYYVYGNANTVEAAAGVSKFSDAMGDSLTADEAGGSAGAGTGGGYGVTGTYNDGTNDLKYTFISAAPIGYDASPASLIAYGGYVWTELDGAGNETTVAVLCEGTKAVVPAKADAEKATEGYDCAAPDEIGDVSGSLNDFSGINN